MNDEIEILENITVNSMLENILTSTKEINQLNIDGGGGGDDDDDDDIICLDTVFKPKRIDDVNGTNFKTFKSQNANLDTRMSSTDLGHNSSTCFVSDLEKDEIPIDELISHPSNLNQSFNKEVSQKRLQDGNTPVEKPGKKLKRIYPKISTKISNDKTKVPMQHPIPPGSVLNVIILILKNVNCLTCKELWDYVSGIFPFFEDHFQEKPGYTKVRRILSKYKQFFLETRSKVTTKESVNLIMLNPAMHSEIDVVIRSIKEKREGFIKSMYSPELFDSLVNGNSKLSDVKLYHDRSVKTNHEFLPLNFKMSSVVSTNTSSTPAGASALKSFTLISSMPTATTASASTTFSVNSSVPEVSLYEDNLKEVNVLDLMDEEERAGALSPKSNSSTDTVVFDPKIVNCRTLNEDESSILTANELDEVEPIPIPSETCGRNSVMPNNILNIISDISLNTDNINSGNAFANTVWSNETEVVIADNSSNSSSNNIDEQQTPIQSFPEIDKCIPKWREIFPWMVWDPRKKTITCSLCESIHKKLDSSSIVIIVIIFHPDDVFSVSKLLRDHSEKYTHKTAYIIDNKEIITILYYLATVHFSGFTSVNEIITTFENLLPKGTNFSQDILKCAIQMMGEYLESKIISKLIVLKKFSLITDPCAGLLIVRYVNENDEPEEHIISSYIGVMDKNPCEYLSSLGVSLKNLIVYVSNSRCEECQRCKGTKKPMYKHGTPARLPVIDRYLRYLWKTNVLRPFYSIGTTLSRLWMSFPHKFSDVSQIISRERLSKFVSKPDVFLDLFQHFDKFQEIAMSIYKLSGNLEALGLQSINVFQYEWLLDAFPILTNINILLLEIKLVFPFHKDFDNLFHATEKFKLFCDKIKGSLREKRLKNLYIDASDIDDLYKLVEITVKEFQQPIYYKGRSLPLSYQRMTTLRNLEAYSTNQAVKNTYIVLFSSIKRNYRYENTSLLSSLTSFLRDNAICQKKDAYAVLQYLQKSKIPRETVSGNVIYTFYRLMAYYPFHMAKEEKNIYEIKIYDYYFYRSAWSGIGPNIKKHLLTLMYELSGRHPLSEKDIMIWWKKREKL